MTELPPWWIYASGIFFILAIVLTVGLGLAAWMMMQKVKAFQETAEKTLHRAEAIADRLENVAKSAQNTVDSIGGSARSVASKVEGAVTSTAEKVEPFMAVLAIASAGLQLYQQFSAMRSKREADETDDSEDD
jgi:hypothetical protein